MSAKIGLKKRDARYAYAIHERALPRVIARLEELERGDEKWPKGIIDIDVAILVEGWTVYAWQTRQLCLKLQVETRMRLLS